MAGGARVTQETAWPRWERWEHLAIPGAVAATWLLALAIDVRPGACPCHLGLTWPWRAALLVLIGAVWLLELRGLRAPRPIFALAITVPAALLNAGKDGALAILFLLLMVAWVSDRGSHRDSLWALGIAVAGTFSYLRDRDVEGLLSVSAAAVCVWLTMRGLRTRRRLVAELRAAQADLALQAARAERRRIAGEIHDVAAHSLAVTMLHLTGARLLLRRLGVDGRAVEALAECERLGRQSLDDLRRTVGLLDDGRAGGTAPPLPTAADLPALVEEFRAAGLDVSLTARGDPARLPPATGLALYRIAQEALANAVRHAPGARVTVALEGGACARLDVRDTGAAPGRPPLAAPDGGTGHGLDGMAERARLLGGHVRAGPDGRGWLVSCVLPGVVDDPRGATDHPSGAAGGGTAGHPPGDLDTAGGAGHLAGVPDADAGGGTAGHPPGMPDAAPRLSAGGTGRAVPDAAARLPAGGEPGAVPAGGVGTALAP